MFTANKLKTVTYRNPAYAPEHLEVPAGHVLDGCTDRQVPNEEHCRQTEDHQLIANHFSAALPFSLLLKTY
jgi:hypothetical protein